MMNKTLKRTLLASLAISLLPFIAASCSAEDDRDPLRSKPKYLLSGSKASQGSDEDDPFEYYHIGTVEGIEQYAVSLKDKSYSQNITIPNEYTVNETTYGVVSGIWANAFHNCPATSITFSQNSNIKTIDYEAFLYSKITSITIPSSVTAIGDGAFYACPNLTTVTFGGSSGQTNIGGVSCACDYNFTPGGQSGSSNVLKVIPSFCFFKCSELTYLTLPTTIEEISYEAFNGCAKLSSTLSFQKIKTIRARAFQGCVSLTKVYVSESMFTKVSDDPNDFIGVIEPLAFNQCGNITFTFCAANNGNVDPVANWLGNNENWGWKNDVGNPTAKSSGVEVNRYGYQREYGNIYSYGDWTYTNSGDDITITGYNGTKGASLTFPDKLPLANAAGYGYVRYLDTGAQSGIQKGVDITMLVDGGSLNVDDNTLPEGVFSGMKDTLQRVYLPTTLYSINNRMFKGLKVLYVIDDNDLTDEAETCALDSQNGATIRGRIDLHRMTSLEFIGSRAFVEMGNGKLNNVTCRDKVDLVHLPANLVAVGPEAFSVFRKPYRFNKVTEFVWDYSDATSCLEIVGNNSFFKLGSRGSKNNIGDTNTAYFSHKLTTLIFPKTFEGFGMSNTYYERYKNRQDRPFAFAKIGGTNGDGREDSNRANCTRPAHIFADCPLLSKIVFKGGEESETKDLMIPLQTFVYNDSLETVVFEERENHKITFHSQRGDWGQQTFGSCSGNGDDNVLMDRDFRGDPLIQSIILPSRNTKLVFQDYAFAACERAAMYFSGTLDENSSTGNTVAEKTNELIYWQKGVNTPVEVALNQLHSWRTIGDEGYHINKISGHAGGMDGYFGYCFSSNAFTKAPDNVFLNTYSLNQRIPIYENVYFEATFKGKGINNGNGVVVKVGDKTSTVQGQTVTNPRLVFSNVGDKVNPTCDNIIIDDGTDNLTQRYAFVCKEETVNAQTTYTATMTNYLYNRRNFLDSEHPTSNDNTVNDVIAYVPAVLTVGNKKYKVTRIGDSAFTACFSDGRETNQSSNVGGFPDLTKVILPQGIAEIGEYAFLRAYGVKEISSYAYNYGTDVASNPDKYQMPSDLITVGKNAFSFCNVKEFLGFNDSCKFYENNHAEYDITSVFSNNFSLRRITFAPKDANDTDPTTSTYYATTTYEHANNDNYTTAIYSKSAVSYNSSRLLLVLNRDFDDIYISSNQIESADTDAVVEKNAQQAITGIRFNGTYSPEGEGYDGDDTNPFLFGAYKMAFWITSLTLGPSTKVSPNSDQSIDQAIFSGVISRTTTWSSTKISDLTELKDTYIYLRKPITDYNGIASDLYSVGGAVVESAKYAFSGCEHLSWVRLEYKEDGELLEGLFDNAPNAAFSTPKSFGSNPEYWQDKTKLDMTYTGYTSLGKDSLRGNSTVKEFTAPITTDFTVGTRAFQNSAVTKIDFHNVTGTLTLEADCFSGCTSLKEIVWPTDPNVTIVIGDRAFQGCSSLVGNNNVTPKTLKFPALNGLTVSSNAFQNCTSLKCLDFSDVTGTLELVNASFKGCTALESIKWPSSAATTVTIKGSAFENCTSLVKATTGAAGEDANAFNLHPRTNFTGTASFKGCSSIVDLVLPQNLANIRTSTFENCSGLTNVSVNGTNSTLASIEEAAFKGCTSLSSFAFSDFTHAHFEIGPNAFEGSFVNNTELVFPSNYETFEDSSFKSTKITRVTFEGDTITIFGSGFASSNLTRVDFTCHTATLNQQHSHTNNFANCTNLTTLFLPSGFDCSDTNTGMVAGDTNVTIYIYGAPQNPGEKYFAEIAEHQYANFYFQATSYSDLQSLINDDFWTFASDGTTPVAMGTLDSEVTNTTPHYLDFKTSGTTTYIWPEGYDPYPGDFDSWKGSIKVNLNGGTGASDKIYTANSGTQQTVTLDTPTREGYVFEKYNIVTQPSGGNASINGLTLTIPAGVEGQIVVEVQWLTAYLAGVGFLGAPGWNPQGSNPIVYDENGKGSIDIVTNVSGAGTPEIKVKSSSGTWYAESSTDGGAPNMTLQSGKIYTIDFYPNKNNENKYIVATVVDDATFGGDADGVTMTFVTYPTGDQTVALQLRSDVTVSANATLSFTYGGKAISITNVGGSGTSDGNGNVAIASAGTYTIYFKANTNGTYDVWVGSVPVSHTYTVTVPDWIWNDNAVIYAALIDGSGNHIDWISCSGSGTTAEFTTDQTFTKFLIARCVAGTTTPSWTVTGDNVGRIYNKTDDIYLSNGVYSYGSNWSSYNP